jgi:AcrR family transcriptional regulator
MTEPDHARRTLRSDAERNRENVVNAARAVFQELGADAPITEIARRAGVGTATLYRRFPTRDDLLGYVFADRLAGCVDILQAARSNPDPWQGLVDYITYVMDLQLQDRAFGSVFFRTFPPDSPIGRSRRESRATLRTLMSAAKTAGALRQDVDEDDIELLFKANEGLLRWTPDPAGQARRLTGWLLLAFHA